MGKEVIETCLITIWVGVVALGILTKIILNIKE